MDDQIGKALQSISTSNQWSLLPSIINKLNKKLPEECQV